MPPGAAPDKAKRLMLGRHGPSPAAELGHVIFLTSGLDEGE
jgi:hypothetical protein